jgi:RNA polymerase sigma factor (sigma-70 family)
MSDSERTAELKKLYRKFPDFKRHVQSFGCPAKEVEDIFQEALVIFCRKAEDPKFELTVDPFHYVKQVGKFLWLNQARKTKIDMEFNDGIEIPEASTDFLEKEIRLRKVESALEQLGDQCRNIINSFYALGMSMVDIAKKFNLRNEKVAKVLKHRCLQKAKTIANAANEIAHNPLNA